MVYFCSDVIWKVVLKKEVKKDYTKIYQVDLDSPRQELSVRGLGFVVSLLVFWEINVSCAFTLRAIQM